ncbi:unnamed protein product [Vitrella brassicaformis CCMP3155]|uniref:Uncharacterized protein n=2 Tax=Vitrella brassicaformis TaxID=1169539 RepID=A0A0G4F391_VITBC|nr:unnamed protein product [Vitrella brassicaformis CCMP3155]|eukprot:CEM06391.1 unnamed protein product [Vitrella brassicaformis CCMP3155]
MGAFASSVAHDPLLGDTLRCAVALHDVRNVHLKPNEKWLGVLTMGVRQQKEGAPAAAMASAQTSTRVILARKLPGEVYLAKSSMLTLEVFSYEDSSGEEERRIYESSPQSIYMPRIVINRGSVVIPVWAFTEDIGYQLYHTWLRLAGIPSAGASSSSSSSAYGVAGGDVSHPPLPSRMGMQNGLSGAEEHAIKQTFLSSLDFSEGGSAKERMVCVSITPVIDWANNNIYPLDEHPHEAIKARRYAPLLYSHTQHLYLCKGLHETLQWALAGEDLLDTTLGTASSPVTASPDFGGGDVGDRAYVDELRRSITAKKGKIQALKQYSRALDATCKTQQETIETFEATHKQRVAAVLADEERKHHEQQALITQLQDRLTALDQKGTVSPTAEQDLKDAKASLAEKEEALGRLKEHVSKLESELEGAHKESERRVEWAQEFAEEANQRLTASNSKIREMNAHVSRLEKEKRDVEGKLDEAARQVESLRQGREGLLKEIEELDNKYQALQQEDEVLPELYELRIRYRDVETQLINEQESKNALITLFEQLWSNVTESERKQLSFNLQSIYALSKSTKQPHTTQATPAPDQPAPIEEEGEGEGEGEEECESETVTPAAAAAAAAVHGESEVKDLSVFLQDLSISRSQVRVPWKYEKGAHKG